MLESYAPCYLLEQIEGRLVPLLCRLTLSPGPKKYPLPDISINLSDGVPRRPLKYSTCPDFAPCELSTI